ncbi:DUF1926 domain-containing protein [bacterium]|nr:DUF1926 domain-containing protein [bacterium]
MNTVSLILCIHNHQPVGNLPDVFEHAFRSSYLPFLEAMERHPSVKFVVHNTGPLLEWFDEHEPSYLERLGALAAAGRVELLTGGFYEPILPVIPERDARGQIGRMTKYVRDRLGTDARGMWVAERVWEPGLARVLAECGVEYVPLDDYEFRLAGLQDEDLTSYFITEDQGALLKVFPISKKLRYLIPFAEPAETISYLQEFADRSPGAIAVFGDDGEKFGVWPGTHKLVYTNHWLDRFLESLVANEEWLLTRTFADVASSCRPAGRVYLPTSSYPEMMEWALPTPARREYEAFIERLKQDGTYDEWGTLVSGGTWRGFLTKYDETNYMASKMRRVSAKVADAGDASSSVLDDLWRGQCNCAYWHGVFGGIYLPHLRSAVYEHLMKAELGVDPGPDTGVAVDITDHDLDGHEEVLLESRTLNAYVAPARGGFIFELDLREIAWNVTATMARHREAYHKLLEDASSQGDNDGTVSIHDAVVAKEEGLADLAVGDIGPRVAAIDHFFPGLCTLADVLRAEENDLLSASGRDWGFDVRRAGEAAEVVFEEGLRLSVGGNESAGGNEIECDFGKIIRHEGRRLVVDYRVLLKNGPGLLFSSEWNIALLTGNPDYTTLRFGGDEAVSAESAHSQDAVSTVVVDDRLRGARVTLSFEPAVRVCVQPLQTASQSEGGFERVYQGLTFFPMWKLEPNEELTCAVSFDWELL